jgi:BASS family bile acid:Na+ symporter
MFCCRPLPVLVGYIAQYMVKPVLGLLVAKAFNVPSAFAAGLILTSCVAGAQLSSYAAFLSEGDTALAIILTSITTITSVLVTPLLTRLFIGSVVPVDVIAMGYSILQVNSFTLS